MRRVKPLAAGQQRQLMLCLQHLAVLLNSGLSLSVALKILAAQSNDKPVQTILQSLRSQLHDGTAMTDAMQRLPYTLPDSVVGYLSVGEKTGQLPLALNHAVDEFYQLQRQRQAITKALRYPAIVGSVALVVTGLLLIWVLPQFSAMFGEQQLPWLTQQLLRASDGLRSHGIGLAITLTTMISATLALRHFHISAWQTLLLHFPVVGRWYDTARLHQLFLRLSMGLAAGMPALQALAQARRASRWLRCHRQLTVVAGAVNEGQRWSLAFASVTKQYPRLQIYLETGEQSGAMDSLLRALTDDLQRHLQSRIERFSRIAEPLLMLVLGGIIGILLLAMYLPIFNLGQQLS